MSASQVGRGVNENHTGYRSNGQRMYESWLEAMRQTHEGMVGFPPWPELRATLKGSYDLAAALYERSK